MKKWGWKIIILLPNPMDTKPSDRWLQRPREDLIKKMLLQRKRMV